MNTESSPKSEERPLRVLFVAMSNSVHTARWVSQFRGTGWDLHMFPSTGCVAHPELRGVTLHGDDFVDMKNRDSDVRIAGAVPWPFPHGSWWVNNFLRRLVPRPTSSGSKVLRLAKLVRTLQPDIVHSLEMQQAGYLTCAARALMSGTFPQWIVTPWGNDLFFYGRLREHESQCRLVLASCDFYGPKSERDIALAHEFGFRGTVLPILPGNGGYDLSTAKALSSLQSTSERRVIMLKGYQHDRGRALFGLKALALAAPKLRDYKIVIYCATPDVRTAAELFAAETGLRTEVLPHSSHDEIMTHFGRARVSMGINVSDGVPNTMLEAMLMGAFPIESEGSCADEWLRHGQTGFIVPPEDPHAIAGSLLSALQNDDLVDAAAIENRRVIEERMEMSLIRGRAVEMYRNIAGISDAMNH